MTENKEYIDAVAAIDALYGLKNDIITCDFSDAIDRCVDIIDTFPTADVVEVVRCKDCKYGSKFLGNLIDCSQTNKLVGSCHFCSYGDKENK